MRTGTLGAPRRVASGLVLALVLALAAPAAAVPPPGTEAAVEAYERGDHADALALFEDAARRTDPAARAFAQYALGVMHLYGQGVAADPDRAVRYLREAAAAGEAAAQSLLGSVLLYGDDGVASDIDAGRRWLEAAAAAGDGQAAFDLAIAYWGADAPLGDDPARAHALAERAVAHGLPAGHRLLGFFALDGYGRPVDRMAAIEHFDRAAAAGDGPAAHELAIVLEEDGDPRLTPALRKELLEIAVADGLIHAMEDLGIMLLDPDGPHHDPVRAEALLADALDGGATQAGMELAAARIERGARDAAIETYKAVARLGSPYGAYMVGYLLATGDPPDAAGARPWLERAAAQDHPDALYLLGAFAADLTSATPDMAAGLAYWERAAALDHALSQYMVANALMSGLAGEIDYPRAASLLREAVAFARARERPAEYALPAMLASLASAEMELRDFDAARAHANDALAAIVPEDPAAGAQRLQALQVLATLAAYQGRFEEAEGILTRTLAGWSGPGAVPEVEATLRLILGSVLEWADRPGEAERQYRAVLAALGQGVDTAEPILAPVLVRLARTRLAQGDVAEAKSLIDRNAPALLARAGPDSPVAARLLADRARLELAEGRVTSAVESFQAAHAAAERAGFLHHPLVSLETGGFARGLLAAGEAARALPFLDAATALYRQALARARGDNRRFARGLFLAHLAVLAETGADDPRTAFDLAQLARANGVGQAVRLAGLMAEAEPEVAALLREREALHARLADLEAGLMADAVALRAAGVRPPAAAGAEAAASVARARDALSALQRRLDAISPDYDQRAGLAPADLASVRRALRAHEALLHFVVGAHDAHAVLVTPTSAVHRLLEIEPDALTAAVRRLRQALDQSDVRRPSDLRPFPIDLAADLRAALFDPFAAELEAVSRLTVIADGALESLPFGVLPLAEGPADGGSVAAVRPDGGAAGALVARGLTVVPDSPRAETAGRPDGDGAFGVYRTRDWLGDRFTLTRLPSVSAFLALRGARVERPAPDAFFGGGDPALSGAPARARDAFGAVRALAPLPETRRELEALAASFDAGGAALLLGRAFSEPALRARDLSRYRVLAFATHGLLSGEIASVDEPALVLSPPAPGETAPAGDALLSASEIARLRLNADLVILSACNTAASDGTPGAEGLSGLARAFFQAGARAVLVSHWAVFSDAAEALTVALATAMSEGELRPGEALRAAARAVRADPNRPHFAHPAFWAPFSLVGAD